MKFILLLLLVITQQLHAQDEALPCDYKIEKISEGQYKIQVSGFDSLNTMESCFLGWMNTGKGKPDGKLFVYDEHGNKRRMAIYKGGIRTGKHLEWYATGELSGEIVWETDLYFHSTDYYKSGKIRARAVNGNRENAVYTSYYENGKIENETNEAQRIERSYYETGQLKMERMELRRTYKEWHANGKLKITGSLGEGGWTRTGKWLYYDKNGKLIRELWYKEENESWYGGEEGFYKEIRF
ncbi:MAG: hypothetical protein NTW29_10380 [Bacteroidetes bacterium]|nr:hypothetical protein [Bacteroidota bacterium]